MIEALVSLRHRGEKAGVGKRRGDVLVVKLPGAPWGREERRVHMIVPLDDPDLESRLVAMRDNGKANPMIVLPYAEYEPGDVEVTAEDSPDGKEHRGLPKLINRSARRVRMSMFAGSPGIDPQKVANENSSPTVGGKSYLSRSDLITGNGANPLPKSGNGANPLPKQRGVSV